MKNLCILFSFLAFASSVPAAAPSLDAFFDSFAAEWMRADPQEATIAQYFKDAEQDALDRQLTPIDMEHRRARVAAARRGLIELKKFDRAAFDEGQRISVAVFEWELDDIVRREPFEDYRFVFQQFRGLQANLVTFLSQMHPIRNRRDIENYLARLEQVTARMDEGITQAHERGDRGILPPRFILTATIDQIGRFIASPPRENVLVSSLDERAAKLAEVSGAMRPRTAWS